MKKLNNINSANSKTKKENSKTRDLGNNILEKKNKMKTRKQIIKHIKSLDFLNNSNTVREYKIINSDRFLLLKFTIILNEEITTITNFISSLEKKVSFSILATTTNNLVLKFNI